MFYEERTPEGSAFPGLYVCKWTPSESPKVIVQIVHGMAEKISRYDAFAKFLAANGALVLGCDLPGHGKSLREGDVPGFFADEKGWDLCARVVNELGQKTREEYPDVPFVLFGHSMGSFIARTCAARYPAAADAYIFCGTAGKNPAVPFAKLIAKSEIKKGGLKTPSTTLDKLSFGAYNKPFKPARTAFDWLSKNEASVDEYVADPLCGFPFTAGGFRDLFDGLTEISSKDWAAKVGKKPILLISGSDDPVGGKKLAGVRWVHEELKRSGHDVVFIEYPSCRHEILNEPEHDLVYSDIMKFVKRFC